MNGSEVRSAGGLVDEKEAITLMISWVEGHAVAMGGYGGQWGTEARRRPLDMRP